MNGWMDHWIALVEFEVILILNSEEAKNQAIN